MKKIISGLFIFIAICSFAQDEIQFQDIPFKDLIAKSKKREQARFY